MMPVPTIFNPLVILLGLVLIVVVAIVAWVASGRGHRQESQDDISLEEIEIAAQKMEERIQNIETILRIPSPEPKKNAASNNNPNGSEVHRF